MTRAGAMEGRRGMLLSNPSEATQQMPPLLWLDAVGWQPKYGYCAFSKGLISTLASFPFCQQQKAHRQERSASVPQAERHLGGPPVPWGLRHPKEGSTGPASFLPLPSLQGTALGNDREAYFLEWGAGDAPGTKSVQKSRPGKLSKAEAMG